MPKNLKGKEIAEIFTDKCIGCQLCTAECPAGAIEISADGVAHVDPEACISCGKCADVCPVGAVNFEKKRTGRKKSKDRAASPEEGPDRPEGTAGYRGVAVYIEVNRDGKSGAEVSWELVGKARELAGKLKVPVIGLLLGNEVDAVVREAISYGCDQVHVIEHPVLADYLPLSYGKALSDLCETVRPEILLMGATPLGRDLAGIVATRLKTGLTADCTGLDIEEETGLLLMTRPTFGGNIMATIFCERYRPQMSTVRPKVMRMPQPVHERQGEVRRHEWTPPEGNGRMSAVVDFIPDVSELGSVEITRSPVLIVAGKGACDIASLELLQELANLLGGVVACSRPVVESGFMPYERQVGQTGKTVAPRLYIGVAVSGAIQHLVAIQGAEKIIAINSDPNAPIFKVADVGLVGDYTKVVPELIAQLRKRQGKTDGKGRQE